MGWFTEAVVIAANQRSAAKPGPGKWDDVAIRGNGFRFYYRGSFVGETKRLSRKWRDKVDATSASAIDKMKSLHQRLQLLGHIGRDAQPPFWRELQHDFPEPDID
jgi:hypothetical protein